MTVRQCTDKDVFEVLDNLAPLEAEELQALGTDPLAVYDQFKVLAFPRAIDAPDGTVVAVSGFHLDLDKRVAWTYMLSTPRWREAVFSMTREARRQFQLLFNEHGIETIGTRSYHKKHAAHRWYLAIGLSLVGDLNHRVGVNQDFLMFRRTRAS